MTGPTLVARPDVFTRWTVGVVSGLVVIGVSALIAGQYQNGVKVSRLEAKMEGVADRVASIDSTQRAIVDSLIARVTRLEIELGALRERLERSTRP